MDRKEEEYSTQPEGRTPIRAQDHLYIEGARVHNLKNVTLSIPHNAITVVTGLSGSGKSSLVFDVIYAEGQRRYMETLSPYARQYLGNLEQPDVDYISGLAPVIAIEQKTTGRNSRSTVGTVTEVYDFLRLLYSKVALAHSPVTGEILEQYSPDEIAQLLLAHYPDEPLAICAPIIRGRKGSNEKLFSQLARGGFIYVRVDGTIQEIHPNMKTDRYAVHDIELVIDRLPIRQDSMERVVSAVTLAVERGNGTVLVAPLKGGEARVYSTVFMCPKSGMSLPLPEPHTFSFNSHYGACPHCRGLGKRYGFLPQTLTENESRPILSGGLVNIVENNVHRILLNNAIGDWLKQKGLDAKTSIKQLTPEQYHTFFWGDEEATKSWESTLKLLKYDVKNKPFPGVVTYYDHFLANLSPNEMGEKIAALIVESECHYCHGTRLKPESLCFRIEGKSISDAAMMPLDALGDWLFGLEERLEGKRRLVAHEILKEIGSRIRFIQNVGLGYLSLNRESDSLSGGESQRIRLATQIGTELVNVMYILDEPSIGLHPRDNTNLILAMKHLRDLGNTVIVVEHDEEMMRAADHIVDLGPGAGALGGKIVAQGSLREVIKSDSLSGQYLSGQRFIAYPAKRRAGHGQSIRIVGATGNNLKGVDCTFPLGTFICITGVAGSGKSTLVNDTLQPILSQHLYRSLRAPLPYERIEGLELVDKVIQVDQSPLGRTPRSNPATYTGIFTDIRRLFAETPEAKIRGYNIGRFSFNVAGGRCEKCNGAGVEVFEMNFLPDVQVLCSECRGQRYNRETLTVHYKGKNIAQVLDMTIAQAAEFFQHVPSLHRKLQALLSVGMGYVKLGQSTTTLSGGESQRIRLASELSKRDSGKTLYILDEPTTGLHFHDISLLLNVLQNLVDKGNTVIVIEHNMDVIKCADWIIDMGPESGEAGGEIVVTGTPEQVASSGKGYTAPYLAEALASGCREKED